MQQPYSARSDKGRTKFTPRDLLVLNWIGDQYTVRLDQVGVLLGRAAQRTTQETGRVQLTTAIASYGGGSKQGW
jgi:hypothetical protein